MEGIHFYILLLALAWSIFNKFIIPKIKNLPPTPFSALTIIGYQSLFKQPIHQTLAQIAARSGPVLLLNFGVRKVLVISSSSAAEDLFSKNDTVFAYRPKLAPGKYFGCDYTTLAWAPHGPHWLRLRRVACLEILPFHRVDQRELVGDEVRLLIGRLFGKEKKVVELKTVFADLMFDVMMRMFAGKSYCRFCGHKMIAKGEVMEALQEYVRQSFKMTTGETDAGYFMPIFKSLGLTSLEKRCKHVQEKGDSLMDTLIQDIKTPTFSNEKHHEREANVIKFLLDKQKYDPKDYSDKIIKGLVLGLTTAGTATSAGIMEWAICHLLNHPEVLLKAQTEIDNYVGNDRLLEQSDIDHLPYLRCIVKETMRLCPVAPLLVPHESLKDCKVGGYNVPKRTMLMVNVWAIHNDPNVWEEPSKFNPERFEGILDERNGFKLMPFGYGRRSCPGKHMATRVIHLALGSLIHCFEWEKVDGKMVDMKEQTGVALLKENALRAVCSPRPTMENLLSKI